MKTRNNPLLSSLMLYARLLFILLLFSLVASGCTMPKRGMMGDNLYFSNQSPSIKVSVNKNFAYRKGKKGEFQHLFYNSEKHRYVYIHHELHDANENRIDYFHHPDHWIYASSSDFAEINRTTKDFIEERWYVQEYVNHISTSACFLTRKSSTFTSMHDVFHILYLWEIPPYKCKDWTSVVSISDNQQKYLEDFHMGYSEDLKIMTYVEK